MAIHVSHETDELEEAHEINVTPFIDVILVLLIIFMAAAPIATVDIPVDLPASKAEQQPRPEKPVYLTLKPTSRSPSATALTPAIRFPRRSTATHGDKNERIFLRADRRPLRQGDGDHEQVARRALSEGGAGRPGDAAGEMSMSVAVGMTRPVPMSSRAGSSPALWLSAFTPVR